MSKTIGELTLNEVAKVCDECDKGKIYDCPFWGVHLINCSNSWVKKQREHGLNDKWEEEKIRKEMNQQIDTATEQLLFNDIVDIYNNKYSKYDDYYKYIVDYNNKARESNTPKISGYCESYRFSFTPLKRILLIRQFNYIRELGLKANNESHNTKSYCESLITKVYLKVKLEKWLELLEQDGCNSKEQVEKEIKEILDQLEN